MSIPPLEAVITSLTSESSHVLSVPKLRKGEFKCFRCRGVFQQKDGDWHAWKEMEVHLCKKCDQATLGQPERGGRSR